MKPEQILLSVVTSLMLVVAVHGHPIDPTIKRIVLDETAVHNLGIQTVTAAETRFVETCFALGRIEAVPARTARVSSRIAGRLVALEIAPGEPVQAGQVIARVESRQPGSHPPVIDLHAPLSGLVSQCELRVGDPVVPDEAIAEILDLSEVYAVVRVPESMVGSIPADARAQIRILALGEQSYSGEWLRFGVNVHPAGGTLDAVFRIPNPDSRIRPGMRAEFHIVLDEQDDVLSLPNEAIQGPPSARHVYVTDPSVPHSYVKVPVVLGRRNGSMTEVIEGICAGDEVVSRGAYVLGFVGDGESLSLKEALDTAHGHPHNEDGSEMTEEQLRSLGYESHDHDHHHEHEAHTHAEIRLREIFFMITTGVLAIALIASSVWRRNDTSSAKE